VTSYDFFGSDSYAAALGRTVLAAAELERALSRLHAQLLRYKHGVLQSAGEGFARAHDGCWALLKAFQIPRSAELSDALERTAELWQRCEAARRMVPPDARAHRELAHSDVWSTAADPTQTEIDRLALLATALLEQVGRLESMVVEFQLTT
jgi:hypothetical protein